jgi:hypothetical protein
LCRAKYLFQFVVAKTSSHTDSLGPEASGAAATEHASSNVGVKSPDLLKSDSSRVFNVGKCPAAIPFVCVCFPSMGYAKIALDREGEIVY